MWLSSGSLPQQAISGAAHARHASRGSAQEPSTAPARNKAGVSLHHRSTSVHLMSIFLKPLCSVVAERCCLARDRQLLSPLAQVQLSNGVAGGIIPELFRPEDLLGASLASPAQVRRASQT